MDRIGRFLDQFTVETGVPALILALLLLMLFIVLLWAQLSNKNTFDVANFLRDENGKESSGRAFGFIALAIHSWWVASLVFQKLATIEHFWAYGLIWAGTPAIMILAQRWGGNLPLAQPGYPPNQPAMPRPVESPLEPPEGR